MSSDGEGDGARFTENGLLPRVEDDELAWSRPDLVIGDDPTKSVVTWIGDITEQLRIVWPAAVNGELVPPPLEHVLDRLVRSEIAGESAEIEAQLTLHPSPGTVAVVYRLPGCDFCSREGADTRARYDGRVEISNRAMGANMCSAHYVQHGSGRLGLGEGQYLMTRDEVPIQVREAHERAREYWATWRVS